MTTDAPARAPLEPCVICHRPLREGGYFIRDDGWPVCRECIAGYVMCPHGYAQRGVCYRCREDQGGSR